MADITTSKPGSKAGKVEKPHPDFPLFPHASGRWAKKVKGKFHYFGKTDDDPRGEAAIKLWLDQKDDILAGRKPQKRATGLTLRYLCNRFLTEKKRRVESAELSARTLSDYIQTCGRIIDEFGKMQVVEKLQPADFARLRAKWATKWASPTTVSNEIGRARVLFRFAYDEGLIEKEVRFGKTFAKPSRANMRKHRAQRSRDHGKRMLEAEELRRLIDAAAQPVKAMILLGINCGLGQSDCSELRFNNLDLDAHTLDYPRPKTGISRRAVLWPITVEAIREAIGVRPNVKEEENQTLVFVTKYGQKWVRLDQRIDAVQQEFQKLLDQLGVNRKGIGFYALRHTFQTVAEGAKDFPAIGLIMGHSDDSMPGRYREGLGDDRLLAVTNYVHDWLFQEEEENHAQDTPDQSEA
jgi:integrase